MNSHIKPWYQKRYHMKRQHTGSMSVLRHKVLPTSFRVIFVIEYSMQRRAKRVTVGQKGSVLGTIEPKESPMKCFSIIIFVRGMRPVDSPHKRTVITYLCLWYLLLAQPPWIILHHKAGPASQKISTRFGCVQSHQKQISRAGTSNYMYLPQYLWDVITGPCPWYMLLAQHSWIILLHEIHSKKYPHGSRCVVFGRRQV